MRRAVAWAMVLGIVCIAGAGMIAWADQTLTFGNGTDLFYLFRSDNAGTYAADGDYLYSLTGKGWIFNTNNEAGECVSFRVNGVECFKVTAPMNLAGIFSMDCAFLNVGYDLTLDRQLILDGAMITSDRTGGAYSYTIGVGDWISGGDLYFTAGVVEVALNANVVTYRFPIPSRIAGSTVVIDRITLVSTANNDDYISEARLESSKAGKPATIATSAAAIKTSPAQWLPSDVTLDADTSYWLEYTITIGDTSLALFETVVEYHTE